MSREFNPVYTGVPRCRLPWRSVYAPVVPCVLDGTLSLLELISKLQYIINQHSEAIAANHTDIMSLAEYVDAIEADLRAYIDQQDTATLNSAKAYTDTEIRALHTYVDQQLAAAVASLRAYIDEQDTATLAAAKTYTDAAVAALRDYVDEQLAGKQDVLTFDPAPTQGSTNPAQSGGIWTMIQAVRANVPLPVSVDRDTQTITTPVFTFAEIYSYLHNAHKQVILEATVTSYAANTPTVLFRCTDYSDQMIAFDAEPRARSGYVGEKWYITVTSSNVWTFTAVTPQ